MREAVLESLLINHPLDCTICDQAGEYKLQEYGVNAAKPSSLPNTRCTSPRPSISARGSCLMPSVRALHLHPFSKDIVEDDALGIVNRGSYNTIATFLDTPFDNNYALNTADICPVGALTSKNFRFQMRVWFLKETNSLCTGCGTGCNTVIGSRENTMYRYEPRDNDAVNGPWMCDAGRLDYKWIGRDRLAEVQGASGWATAITEISGKLEEAAPGSVAIIASARQTNEELFLLKKLAAKFEAPTDIIARTGEAVIYW